MAAQDTPIIFPPGSPPIRELRWTCACPFGFVVNASSPTGNKTCENYNECTSPDGDGVNDYATRTSLDFMYTLCFSGVTCTDTTPSGTFSPGFSCGSCPSGTTDAGYRYAVSVTATMGFTGGDATSFQSLAMGKNCAYYTCTSGTVGNLCVINNATSTFGLCSSTNVCSACNSTNLTKDICQNTYGAAQLRDNASPTQRMNVASPVLQYCLCGDATQWGAVDGVPSPSCDGCQQSTQSCLVCP